MLPEKMDLKVIPETSKQFGVVRGWLQNPQISSLVIATDAGGRGNWSPAGSLRKRGAASR